ncbi:MAG: type I restriction endonuclease subunit R [Bacteroidales bacterium]|nr:type I restriction endonuclease subunit R [Bacteroidales bacterium]MBP7030662.1 type I restriction endonuclease subunit R [Spirochaetota bacterium]
MTRLTESAIEEFAIELLEMEDYQYISGPDIAPDGERAERKSSEDVLLLDRLTRAVQTLNPGVPFDAQDDAIKQIQRFGSQELIVNNEAFHRMLTEGIRVQYRRDGGERGDLVRLIDYKNLENNEYLVVNQYTVIEGNNNKRPDIVLFVNGIPLVVMELKNPADEQATINSAFKQIETYKNAIPALFHYNGFIVISDGLEAKAGSISSGFSQFMAWKSINGRKDESRMISPMETLIKGMLNKKTLLDIICHFIVFDKSKSVDEETGQTSIRTIKKMAYYHQYFAVNKAVESTLRASGYLAKDKIDSFKILDAPEMYGLSSVENQPPGDRKGGVIWHTQGSGKSLSMVFFAGKIIQILDNPTIVVITDRNDLDDQLFDTFCSSKQILRQEPVQAESREHLKALLNVASGGVVFTTIQKFQTEEGNIYPRLSERSNVIVIVDEAHRSQYGFKAKTIDEKDENGKVIGKRVVYGFAKYLRDALPNATYIGFTGTPIEKEDKNTPAVFGNYVDVYDISQAEEDGAIVKIYYESRLAKIELSEEGKRLIKDLDQKLQIDELAETQKVKARWTRLESLIGSRDRIKHIAEDIVSHFEQRQEVFEGKGMIVTMSRRIAVDLYNEIIKLRPKWHSDDLKKGGIKVVMTSSSSDGPDISKHHTTKEQRRNLAERMKDPDNELKMVIVCDMWLTGFDVPCLHTMYLDKLMRGHTLMQAIARVNRVYKDKPGGLIVDYLGIASDLKEALSFYSDSGGKGDPAVLQEQAVQIMAEKLEVVNQMFNNFDYKRYFQGDTSTKLSVILSAEDYILSLENGKKRYIDEVTALSKAFSIAIPHDKAMAVRDEVGFFQAVKARLVKFDISGREKTDDAIETTIRQVIDKALVTDKVIDIFDAAGIKKPDISILSEDFLLEVQNMEHKNIALEVLKSLLNNEIKTRMKKNLVQSKTLMEMLENSIKRYHNKVINAIQVIEELIELSKEIKRMDKEPAEMNLSDYEYAFYTAIADNKSARELMQKETLRELAVVLYQKVKQNASIDWTIKESVRAKLKVIVKRTLRQYGYPPDMQAIATETVLKQAEMIADELTRMG